MFNLIKTMNDVTSKRHIVESTSNLHREAKHREADQHGNVNSVEHWTINNDNYPLYYSSSGDSFLRKYDYEELYSPNKTDHQFKMKDIKWVNNEKNIS